MRKIGLLIFAEGKMREDVYQSRKPAMEREVSRLLEAIGDVLELFRPAAGEIRDKRGLVSAIEESKATNVGAFLFYVPMFVSAATVAMGVRLAGLPCALLGNYARDTFSQVGYLASAGAIEQAGLPYKRVTGDITQESTKSELLSYFRAACADRELLGKTYGMFGGRSLGISTGTADTAQWLQLFGVDLEHIDQLELVRVADTIETSRVARHVKWVKENYGAVCFKEGRFEEKNLERMVRSYLAAKDIIELYQLDFVGIKCQPELSNGYALQCLTVQLLNDLYDADGAKRAVVCSCEADADGALTMEILNLLSDGSPTALQDVYFYDEEVLVLANCGSSASWFAKRSENARENLKEVHLQPHAFGAAGGAATQFTFAPGTYTYARLQRYNLRYRMSIFKGELDALTREDLQQYAWYRPTARVRGVDSRAFAKHFGSNHAHCVAGDYVAELIEFCEIKGFEYFLLNKK
ncbi:L-fucose isomerase [Synergistales bacterium]|nr:L-fucose isomerase [Synergistales bacterium]